MEQKDEIVIINEKNLESMIYEIRGQKVMLDMDLARIYGYTTKAFNQQVKRNMEKFEDDFMFQLTMEEIKSVRSQIVTSPKTDIFSGQNGGTRHFPYAFTEQGIYMLMTVLKGELATEQSKALIRTFKGMKDYIADSQGLLNIHDFVKLSLQTTENTSEISKIKKIIDEEMLRKSDLPRLFRNFQNTDTGKEFLLLNGQLTEADAVYQTIYEKAKHSIYIVDDYIGVKTILHLRNISKEIEIIIFTDNRHKHLSKQEWEDFKSEYPHISISFRKTNRKVHDRYIILDFEKKSERIYHCGGSSKDAGKRVTTITELSDRNLYKEWIKKLKENNISEFFKI